MKSPKTFLSLLVASAAILPGWRPPAHAVELKSPDGRVLVSFDIREFEGVSGCPVYTVSFDKRPVVTPSRMGFELLPRPLTDHLEVAKQTHSAGDTTWHPPYGERSTIRDHYNQVVVELQEREPPNRRVDVTFRAYNEGAAFCYTFPKQQNLDGLAIAKELTEFRLSGDFAAWATYTAQGIYTNVPISRIRPGCERPLVIRAAEDLYAAIAEARCVDYARTKFAPLAGAPHSLVTELGSEVTSALPLRTPWRVVMLGESPGQLLERNDIILNLNDPCAIADTGWVKPGKVIREVTLSTLGGKACIDFAAKHNLQYIEFDAGWYGPEGLDTSDARAVNVNTNRPQGGLDLHEVVRYGAKRGVGVLLYVNRRELERRVDDLLPLYHRWGIKGIKAGFVNVGSQPWTSWLHNIIQKAAAYQLMVDVHDEYRPTGWSRTYPNLLTQEGIRGDEEKQPNHLNLVTVFTRMLAGAGDQTICYYDERVDRQTTHAYQLAKAVCLYSPWQFVYWYDRPFISREVTGRAPTANNILGDEPELEFFDHCPTVWDDTKVLRGAIGAYAVIARRTGEDWFIGAMNTDEPRTFDTPLTFLSPGRKYVAHVYSDDPLVSTRTHVKIERFTLTRNTTVKISMPARGGQALRITPATAMDSYPNYPQ